MLLQAGAKESETPLDVDKSLVMAQIFVPKIRLGNMEIIFA